MTYPGWNIDDVAVVSIQGGSNTVQTQADGSYSIAPPMDPCTMISELKGSYCDIDNAAGSDARFEQSGVHPDDVVSWTWDSGLYNVIDEPSVYRHINYIHDYYRDLDPGFSDLDYPMPALVHIPDYNNAYWDGEGVAFGTGDGAYYDNFGLYSEVVYHEYTHGVTDRIYAGIWFPYAAEPGAMNEAWSDYFGCALSLTEGPKVGDGGLVIGSPDGFRTLDNAFRRETDWYNEVHVDSQMFSGGLWEARQAIGADVMDELVHFACYAHATSFEDYVLAILIEDDTRYGDSDLSNGTPHGQAIYAGFGNHGIGGLQYVAPIIFIDDASGNNNGKLDPGETVNLSLTLTNGWADATNVQATLASTDPFVVITKASASLPDANHGGLTSNAADPFVVSVLAGCPETHTIRFTLEVTADGPYSYSRTCLLYSTVAVEQLAYDDGGVEWYLGYGLPGGGLAVRVTPDSYPCYPTHVRLFPAENATVTVNVWDDNGPGGSPGAVLASLSTNVTAAGNWVDVDISSLGLIIDSGSVYVGWVEGSAVYYNGFDGDPPYYGRSWVYDGWDWYQLEDFYLLGNVMVRLRWSTEPPLLINPPYEYAWEVDEPVSDCLSASNGTPPYHDWVAPPQPGYQLSIMDSSLFAASGDAQGWHADDASWSYALPFAFPYYGSSYSSVNVCSNGFLDFASTSADYTNSTEGLSYSARIAPLWDDLRTDQGGGYDVYVDQVGSDEVRIRWEATTYGSGAPCNFSASLFSDGRIRFDYGAGNTALSPTVGISAGNGSDYVVVPGYDGVAWLGDANSVLLSPSAPVSPLPPGVTLDPDTGCFAGAPTEAGIYTATIQVTDSADPPKTAQHSFEFQVIGPAGCALEFDGSDFMVVPHSEVFDVGEGDLTVELWLQGGPGFVLDKREDRPPGEVGFFMQILTDGRIQFAIEVPEQYHQETAVISPDSVMDGLWHHVAGVREGDTIHLYIDGQWVASEDASMVGNINNSEPIRFGARHTLSSLLRGVIDEAHIWNTARSAQQIRGSMGCTLHGDEEGLVGCWRFDDCSGQYALDSSPAGNDGRLGANDYPQGDYADPRWVASGALVGPPLPLQPEPGTLVFQDGREYPDRTIYAGTRDAYIFQGRALYNTGCCELLEAARQTGGYSNHDRSIVIKFTGLDTSLEADNEFEQAVLTLNYTGSRSDPGGVSKTLYIHKLLHDWGEGTQTGIDGAWAGPGEVCWIKPFGATGGDNPNWNGTLDDRYADPIALDSVTLGGSEDCGPVSFDVTAAVLEHLADPSQNFGFVIREEEGSESTEDGSRQFRSREGVRPAYRPSLTLTFVPRPAMPLKMDIKPGSCPNSFNRDSHGVLPVALLGTAEFDVGTIELASVELARADGVGGSAAPYEGPPGPHSVFEDVATPFEGEPCECHDLEGDGIDDLSMKFKTDDLVSALGLDSLDPGALLELVVTGNLVDGTPFIARDCIRLVPPGSPATELVVRATASGAWLAVSPLDIHLDGGGFADPEFVRSFPETSVVTVVAAPLPGRCFLAWEHNGVPASSAEPSIVVTMLGDQMLEAVYSALGDVNGDGAVNVRDLSAVRMYFGADVTEGDNVKYDINDDGVVNALDMSECRRLFSNAAP